MASFETIAWRDGTLVLLDQRALPVEEVYVTCQDWQSVATSIETMVVRGAPAIGITAAWGVVLGARAVLNSDDPPQALDEIFAALAATRPTAVNLFWALDRMRRVVAQTPSEELLTALEQAACAIHEEDKSMCSAMGRHGASLFTEKSSILTHCNTGALATGGDGTALSVIRTVWRDGRLNRVYADETRPFLQGSRLTAWELHRDEIPTRVITDSMAPWLMKKGLIDAVIVGTDRVAANGDVANKIGTYGLAIACQAHGIPFYVAGPTSTIDLDTPNGEAIEIERRPDREVTHVGDVRIVPTGVDVENPAFDVTPAALVTALITEQGILRGPYAEGLKRHVAEANNRG